MSTDRMRPRSSRHYHLPRVVMRRLIVAPNGVAYAPPESRPGVLPRMLAEILGTRIMVGAPSACGLIQWAY